jgi:hypothetical protein
VQNLKQVAVQLQVRHLPGAQSTVARSSHPDPQSAGSQNTTRDIRCNDCHVLQQLPNKLRADRSLHLPSPSSIHRLVCCIVQRIRLRSTVDRFCCILCRPKRSDWLLVPQMCRRTSSGEALPSEEYTRYPIVFPPTHLKPEPASACRFQDANWMRYAFDHTQI